jgi:hypothetical protein
MNNMKSMNLAGHAVTFMYKKIEQTILDKKGNKVNICTPIFTTVLVETKNKERLTGKAICSVYDNCKKETGRKLALTRALLSSMELKRSERKEIWDAYNNLKPGKRWN